MIEKWLKEHRDHLMAFNSGMMEMFVHKHGKSFKVKQHQLRMGPMKECFRNTAQYVLSHPGSKFKYCEGFAIRDSLGILMMHAWLVDDEGNAYDLTWSDAQECHYYGITFNNKQLMQQLHKNGVYGLLDLGIGYNMDLLLEIDPTIVDDFKTASKKAAEDFAAKLVKLNAMENSDHDC